MAITLGKDRPYKPRWDENLQRWIIKASSRKLYELLKDKDLAKIKPYVEHCERCMAGYVRGLADSEGSANRDEKHLGHIRIAITNPKIIHYTAVLLRRLGIDSKTYRRTMKRQFIMEGKYRIRWKQTLYTLTNQRKVSIKRYRYIVGFSIKRKQTILKMVE